MEIDKLTDERYLELYEALTTVIDSEEIFEELENANYHGVIDFLAEIRDCMCVHELGPKYEDYGETAQDCVKCGNQIYTGESWE